MNPPTPLRRDRIRTIEKPFGWVPCRILVNGLFANLSDDEKLLYFFLSLAADRLGMSYFGDYRIQSYFQRQATDIIQARNKLIPKDLLAYDGYLYQILSLPGPTAIPTIPSKITSEPERRADILARLADISKKRSGPSTAMTS